jgi:putative tryptophan/tyrosine transport system substrate-binding protein
MSMHGPHGEEPRASAASRTLMVRSAGSARASRTMAAGTNGNALATSFETRTACAPQDEGQGCLHRRALLTLLGGAAAAWPLAGRAQQALPAVGFLSTESREGRPELLAAFRRGLGEAGLVEGRDLVIEARWAEGQYDRLRVLAAELVRRQMKAIAAIGTQAAVVAQAETRSTPIVFVAGADPVEIGLVASLSRPAGNLTGVSVLTVEVAAKRLELLHELVPAATLVAVLGNSRNPVLTDSETKVLQTAARVVGVHLLTLDASNPDEIEAAFAALVRERAGALLVMDDPIFNAHRVQFAVLEARHGVPAIHQFRESTAAGSLMSYGPSLPDAVRQVGVYTARILNGDKPSDLPVQQSTKFELVINLRTAKALGLTVPITLLGRADEVIE